MKKKLHVKAIKGKLSHSFLLLNTGSYFAEYITSSEDPVHNYILWVKSTHVANKESHINQFAKWVLTMKKEGYKVTFYSY